MMIRRSIVPGVAAALVIGVVAAAAGGGAHTTLTSRGPDDVALGSSTYWRSISGDGKRAVFTSDDDALPGADGTRDVFVRDLKTRKTTLVSRSTSGEPVNESTSDDPAISGNGRFVAFDTDADNLPGGAGGTYVRDLRKKTTKLVSKTRQGEAADDSTGEVPTLSAGGRFVSFEVDDDDFPGADGTRDAYVRDRKRGTLELVSRTSDGDPVDTDTGLTPTISGNGRFVAFRSDSDLLPGDDATGDVYVRDRKRKTTTLVSRTPAGDPASFSFSYAGCISFDGRFVAFESEAPGIGADPSGSVYVRDRKRGKTTLVSRQGGGDPAIGEDQSISSNGRYVVYDGDDNDLAGADGVYDVYRFDRKTKQTTLVSRATNGDPGDDDSFYASISGSGAFVSFSSRADNLSGQDDDAYSNTFVRGPLP